MASRSLTIDNTAPTTEDVLSLMFENDAYEISPYTFGNLAVELSVEISDIQNLLSADELDDLISNDPRGNVWFDKVYASKDEMLAECAVPVKPAPRTRKTAAKPVAAKVVTSAPESAKVDNTPTENTPEDESKDADMTETPTVPTTPAAPKGWEMPEEETHMVEYKAGEQITGHTILPAPETIPAPPEGVNPNMWELYKSALTMNARVFWGKKVAEQIKAHSEAVKAAESAPAPAAPIIIPVDPVTGEAFPF